MITSILAILSAVALPVLSYLIKDWIKAKEAETPAERKQNEINKAIVKHDAGPINAAIADRMSRKTLHYSDLRTPDSSAAEGN